jgi:hypothetical protein
MGNFQPVLTVQGSRREAWSESSVEQRHKPMDKNRIRGIRRRTSGQTIAKSTSIKGAGCKFGGCVLKAVEFTSGGLSAYSPLPAVWAFTAHGGYYARC